MALDVHLVTPEREVWAGPAEMVVAHGTDGMVGILAGHAPLLIRLAIDVLRIQLEDGRWEVAVVDGGFLHVTNDEGSTRVDRPSGRTGSARAGAGTCGRGGRRGRAGGARQGDGSYRSRRVASRVPGKPGPRMETPWIACS